MKTSQRTKNNFAFVKGLIEGFTYHGFKATPKEIIFELAEKEGINKKETLKIIDLLMREGYIFERKQGFLEVISVYANKTRKEEGKIADLIYCVA